MKKVLLATLLCLLYAASAMAEPPIQVRLEGYVGDPPAGAKPGFSWTVMNKDKTYKLQVMKHESLSASISTMDINDRVKMNDPNFYLGGDDKAIAAFTSAKAGQLVKISSNIRLGGSRNELDLDTVTPLAEKK